MRRFAIVTTCLVLALLLCGALFTPWTWKWSVPNLQVSLHDTRNERIRVGSSGEGFGWSKTDLIAGFLGSSSTGRSADRTGICTFATKVHIASIGPGGISVRVHHDENFYGTQSSFDRLIFVPAHGVARVDVSPDFYVTGAFE